MNNITSKELNKYREVLDLDVILDMNILILKYENALHEYYHNDIGNIDKLNLIINAFYFFSGFEKGNVDVSKLVDQGIGLLETRKDASEHSFSEIIYIFSFMISKKMLENHEMFDELEIQKRCDILSELFSVIEAVEVYEKSIKQIK